MDFAEAKRIIAAFEPPRGGLRGGRVDGHGCAGNRPGHEAPDEANVGRLRAALRDLFGDPAVESITAEDLGGEYPAIQYVPPGDYWIDILSRLGEAFRFSDLESEVLDLDGVAFRTATARTLYRMKKDTARPQDQLDAGVLKERFGLEDE